MKTVLKKAENFKERMHRNASVSYINSKHINGTTYRIYLNYFNRKVLMETVLQKTKNFQEKCTKIRPLTV